MFEEDALIAHKLLNLNFMGNGKQLHVGFPESSQIKYCAQLVDNGFKVALIEPTESAREADNRRK